MENRDDQGNVIESEKKLAITLDFTLEQYKMIRNMASMNGRKEKDFLEKVVEKYLMHGGCDCS